MQRCKTRVPGSTIEPNIMAQTIPYCPICRKTRDAGLEALKSKPKSKGKGKAQWGSENEDEENEWGGGEPGIMKVRSITSSDGYGLINSRISHSLAKLLISSLMNAYSKIEKRWIYWSS